MFKNERDNIVRDTERDTVRDIVRDIERGRVRDIVKDIERGKVRDTEHKRFLYLYLYE